VCVCVCVVCVCVFKLLKCVGWRVQLEYSPRGIPIPTGAVIVVFWVTVTVIGVTLEVERRDCRSHALEQEHT
jgi:hypothetical protein